MKFKFSDETHHVTCDVPRCPNVALYAEEYGVYCSLHCNGRAPNLASWILHLGLEMGIRYH